MNNLFEQFKEKLLEIEHLSAALGLLEWDTNVNMPPKGSEMRGKTVSVLSALIHEKMMDKDFESMLTKLKLDLDKNLLNPEQAAIVREEYRLFNKEKKLPASFVKELAETTSSAHTIWVEAKKKSDFKKFAPQLTKIVELKRTQAKLIGYKDSSYDALLDDFEPNLSSAEVSLVFEHLKDFLVPFLQKIRNSNQIDTSVLKGRFELPKQQQFNALVAKEVGYDFEAGRMDESAHPFSLSFNPLDARITTRYKEEDFYYSLGSTIHEVGHALYEQGLKPEHFGTPLGNSVSLGIHESQSRVWENMVGKSFPFWKYFFPKAKQHFPHALDKINLEQFFKAINAVKPSLIRTESDEVTYNLHIIIRFEIEKALIEGTIEVNDLPKIWNEKYKEYLGVEVPNDTQGILQDVHWSGGLFGYFPTYSLGNLYSAQFFAQASKDIENLDNLFEKGQFQPFLQWLRTNIHQHGKMYSAHDLCQRVTGDGLNPKHYIDYITQKFSALYGL